MKPVKFIQPKIARTGRLIWPRCAMERVTRYMNDTPTSDKQCALSARVDYRGTLLCVRHASARALHEVSEGAYVLDGDGDNGTVR